MRGPKPLRIFLMGILALTPAAQAFWFVWVWRALGAVPWLGPRHVLQGLWLVAALVVLVTGIELLAGPVISRRVLGPWARAVARLWLIASCIGFLGVIAVGGIEWLSRPITAALPEAQRAWAEPARSLAFRYAALLAGGLPLLATAYGATVGRLRYRVVPVDVPMAHLPPHLDGLRIAHLSDLHIGDFMSRAGIRRAVDRVNALRPDLVVVTGDLITGERDPLEDCIEELSRLRVPLGVWGCHGNHEHWVGAENRAQALFERHRMHLLRQQAVELSWRGGRVNLIGVDDQRERARPGEPSSMLRGIEGLVRWDIPNILLSHNPDTFPRAAALGIELSLAGHTHGGQFRVALGHRQWSPASLVTPFAAGLYHRPLGPEGRRTDGESSPRKSARLYVNSGLGTFGLPVRLGVPPEITVLTLRKDG